MSKKIFILKIQWFCWNLFFFFLTFYVCFCKFETLWVSGFDLSGQNSHFRFLKSRHNGTRYYGAPCRVSGLFRKTRPKQIGDFGKSNFSRPFALNRRPDLALSPTCCVGLSGSEGSGAPRRPTRFYIKSPMETLRWFRANSLRFDLNFVPQSIGRPGFALAVARHVLDLMRESHVRGLLRGPHGQLCVNDGGGD